MAENSIPQCSSHGEWDCFRREGEPLEFRVLVSEHFVMSIWDNNSEYTTMEEGYYVPVVCNEGHPNEEIYFKFVPKKKKKSKITNPWD